MGLRSHSLRNPKRNNPPSDYWREVTWHVHVQNKNREFSFSLKFFFESPKCTHAACNTHLRAPVSNIRLWKMCSVVRDSQLYFGLHFDWLRAFGGDETHAIVGTQTENPYFFSYLSIPYLLTEEWVHINLACRFQHEVQWVYWASERRSRPKVIMNNEQNQGRMSYISIESCIITRVLF